MRAIPGRAERLAHEVLMELQNVGMIDFMGHRLDAYKVLLAYTEKLLGEPKHEARD